MIIVLKLNKASQFLFLWLMFVCINCSYAQLDSLLHNNITRTYLTHLPSGYTGTTPLSLIIAMHGGLGSAANLQDQSLLSVKADAEHFIVVYPEGVKNILGIRTWNAGWCCGYASTNNIDDVGFINVLIDSMISQYNIDTTRIYATGMSNGGFMSYRLACELSNRIAAIAPVAASMAVPACNPSRPVPIIHFHSYLDTNVPHFGGVGNGISNHWNSPHDSVLNAWSLKNNCTVANDTIVNDSLYTFIKWHPCDCNSEIDYYITNDGGHSWPGGTATAVGDPVSVVLNANDLMWDFFQLHSLNCDSTTALNNNFATNEKLKVYPNPSDGIFNFDSANILELKIVDVFGRVVYEKQGVRHNNLAVDLSGFPNGIYVALTQMKDQSYVATRLVKTH